jgi:hypothetical protein
MTITFPTIDEKAPAPQVRIPTGPVIVDTGNPAMLIKGIPAGSQYEWNMSLALDTLGIEYRYQVPINYGRARLGGQVLDFEIYAPRFTILDVRSSYWHTGAHEDELSFRRAVQRAFGSNVNVLIAWDKDAITKEAALAFLKANLAV